MINTECLVSTKGMRIWKVRETMNRNDTSMEWFRNLYFDTYYMIHLRVTENSKDARFYVLSDRRCFVDYVTINVVLKIEN